VAVGDFPMHPKHFIAGLDGKKVMAAIADAERKTSGEIRVGISHTGVKDVLVAAQECFRKLGMERTRHRNGVLIYFVPSDRQFAVWGDTGLHEKCGDSRWQEIAAHVTPLLKSSQYTDATLEVIRRVSESLSLHFPRQADDVDELPNSLRHE